MAKAAGAGADVLHVTLWVMKGAALVGAGLMASCLRCVRCLRVRGLRAVFVLRALRCMALASQLHAATLRVCSRAGATQAAATFKGWHGLFLRACVQDVKPGQHIKCEQLQILPWTIRFSPGL